MKNRVPTLDEYIAESKLIIEGFDWNARKLAAAWSKSQDKEYELDDMEITIWVALSNLLNLYEVKILDDSLDKFMVKVRFKNKFLEVTMDTDKDIVNMYFRMVTPDDPDSFEKNINNVNFEKEPGCVTETVSYNLQKMNARATVHAIEKMLKRLFYIL